MSARGLIRRAVIIGSMLSGAMMAFSLTGVSNLLQHKETKPLLSAWEHMYLTENVLLMILKNTASLHFLYGVWATRTQWQFFAAAFLTGIGDPVSCILMDRMNDKLMSMSYAVSVHGYTSVDYHAVQHDVLMWSVLFFVRSFEPLVGVWLGLAYMPVW